MRCSEQRRERQGVQFPPVRVSDVVHVLEPFGEQPGDGGVEALAESGCDCGEGVDEDLGAGDYQAGEDVEVVAFDDGVEGGGDAVGTGGLVGFVGGLKGGEEGVEGVR